MTPLRSLIYSVVTAVILVILLSSCKVHKNISKEKSESTTQTSEQTKSVETGSNSSLSSTQRTITEETNYPVIVPSDSSKAEIGLKELIEKGEFESTDGDETLSASVENGKLKLKSKRKAKQIQVPGKRTTVENSTVASQGSHTVNTDSQKGATLSTKSESFKKEVTRSYWSWWYLLILIVPVGWWVWKRRS